MNEPDAAPTTRKRGRPPKISIPLVVERALEIGFADLTFAELARQLSVSETTLYAHVPDRASLVQVAMNHQYEHIETVVPGKSWRATLEAEAEALWAMLERDPALAVEAASGPPVLASVAYFNRMARPLLDAGYDPTVALLAADSVFHLVQDVFVRTHNFEEAQERVADAGNWMRLLDHPLQAVVADAFGDLHSTLRYKLKLLLDGIAAAGEDVS